MEYRTPLLIAQALPLVLASLQQTCSWSAALAAAFGTGTFLHVQQSLLSDLDRHEHQYLEVRVGGWVGGGQVQQGRGNAGWGACT